MKIVYTPDGKKPSRKAELKFLLNLCEELSVSGPDRGVLTAIWVHTDDAGWCYPSVGTLALMSGLTERRVRTSLVTLSRFGIVPSLKAKKSGELKAGAVSLRRGQSLFLLWPLASTEARIRLVGQAPWAPPIPPVEGREWVIERPGAEPAGPYHRGAIAQLIEDGLVSASTRALSPDVPATPIAHLAPLACFLPLLPP